MRTKIDELLKHIDDDLSIYHADTTLEPVCRPCKFCGENGLYWSFIATSPKPLLTDKYGNPHACKGATYKA